jgi:hypothetical protein
MKEKNAAIKIFIVAILIILYGCTSSFGTKNLNFYSEFVELYINEFEKNGSEEDLNEYKDMSLKYYELIKNSLYSNTYSKEEIEEFNAITEKCQMYNILSKK